MKKLKLLIILLLLLCILTGCWDSKVHEKIGFMLSVGIEKSPNGILVTYISPLIDPEQQQMGKLAEISSAEDVTLTREAREKARLKTTRNIEAGLTQQVLFVERPCLCIMHK